MLKITGYKVNGGLWTPARFNAFIKSGLRSMTYRWGPKNEAKKDANTRRGYYMCVGYGIPAHEITTSVIHKDKRVSNVHVDHIDPVIDPDTGFTSWDAVIKRMFCEKEGFQILCRECHYNKTQDERKRRKK
jgi:hypothetical protein